MADNDLLAAYAFLADGEDTPENRKALARLLRSLSRSIRKFGKY